MALGDNQKVSHLESSCVNQAGRDLIVNQGLNAADVIAIVKSVVASELNIYTQKAERVAEERLNHFSDDLVGKLAEKVANHLDRFNEPALQFAVREAALGYVRSGSDVDENNLIDLMIERVMVDEHSTKQKLIDQAIKIVPTLSAESLAMLSLLAFRELSFGGSKQGYNIWVTSINSVVDVISSISVLDIEYLQQAGCTTGLSGLQVHNTWEKSCAKNLDLLFRHLPPDEAVSSFLQNAKIQLVNNGKEFMVDPSVANSQQIMMFFASAMVALPEMKVGFNIVDSRTINKMLQNNGLAYLQPSVEALKDASTPFTLKEIVGFFEAINPNWRNVIDLFNSDQVKALKLTPVGSYIGCRQLAMLSGRDIPIDIFYN